MNVVLDTQRRQQQVRAGELEMRQAELRCLLTHGARSVLVGASRQRAAAQPLSRPHQWAVSVRDRRGHNKATIAVANKLGRVVWAVWSKDVPYTMAVAA